MNQVNLIGRLTGNQKIYPANNSKEERCYFSLAINRKNFNTVFVPCVVYGKNAKFLSSLAKGKPLYILGSLFFQSDDEDKKGLRVRVHVFEFLPSSIPTATNEVKDDNKESSSSDDMFEQIMRDTDYDIPF